MNMFEDATDRESSLAEVKRSIRTAVLAKRKAIPEAERITRSARICDALIEKLDELLRERDESMRDESARGASVRDESARSKNAQDKNAPLEALQTDALQPEPSAAQSTPSAAHYTVAVYCAIASEVSLDRFIDYAYERGCLVCFPCMEEIALVQSAGSSQGDRPNDFSDDHPETSMFFRDVSAEAFARKEAQFLTHPARAYRAGDPELSAFPLVPAQDIDLAIIPLVAFDMSGNRLGYGKGNYDRFLPSLSPTVQLVGVAFAEQQVDALPCEPFDKPLPEIISR